MLVSGIYVSENSPTVTRRSMFLGIPINLNYKPSFVTFRLGIPSETFAICFWERLTSQFLTMND